MAKFCMNCLSDWCTCGHLEAVERGVTEVLEQVDKICRQVTPKEILMSDQWIDLLDSLLEDERVEDSWEFLEDAFNYVDVFGYLTENQKQKINEIKAELAGGRNDTRS